MSDRDSICAPVEKPAEEWRRIPSYPDYEASSLGRIRSLDHLDALGRFRQGKVLSNARISGRYYRIRIGRFAEESVHLLVLEAYRGPRPSPEMHGCHNNGNVADNSVDNLRWDTASANQLDKIAHGTIARGERNGSAKLDNTSAKIVKQMLALGVSTSCIASIAGVSRQATLRIKSGETWSWAEAENPSDELVNLCGSLVSSCKARRRALWVNANKPHAGSEAELTEACRAHEALLAVAITWWETHRSSPAIAAGLGSVAP